MEKLKIVVSGFIGSFCLPGITWHYIQYPVGLLSMGHDVYYIEDTCGVNYFYDPAYEWGDPTPVVNYLSDTMEFFGLKDRWAYRDEQTGNCYGLSIEKVKQICADADILINISCSIYLRDEYMNIPKRVLIDTDPMFTQLPIKDAKETLSKFTHHFSFGNNINNSESKIPKLGFDWMTTVQPVCLQYWENEFDRREDAKNKEVFTTIMNISSKKKLEYNNDTWGQKDVELDKIIKLPLLYRSSSFEIVAAGKLNASVLNEFGWHLSDKLSEINSSIKSYQKYIKGSFAEFSVAKETYVKANTGWFSDRTACFLASGRPAVVQDTQWSKYFPSGKGLFAFSSMDDIIAAIDEVTGNYKFHCNAALEIAREYFKADKVLNDLIENISCEIKAVEINKM